MSIFIIVIFEFFKNLFIKVPTSKGMVELKEEQETQDNQREEGNEVTLICIEKKNSCIQDDNFDSKLQIQEAKEVISPAQRNPSQVYSESTQRDNISSQRQLASSRAGDGVGTKDRQMVNLGNQGAPDEEAHQSSPEDIVLTADEFEEPTVYHKLRLAFGVLLVLVLWIGSTLLL